jgi:hypothetical protein
MDEIGGSLLNATTDEKDQLDAVIGRYNCKTAEPYPVELANSFNITFEWLKCQIWQGWDRNPS